MIPQLKAEFKKLLTVRSTFIVSLVVIVFTGLLMFAMTAQVYEDQAPTSSTQQRQSKDAKTQSSVPPPAPKLTKNLPPTQLLQNMQNVIPVMSLLITVVVVLLMAHEYRYNTIMHTLTLSNNRSKVLAGKIAVGFVYVAFMTGLVIVTCILVTQLAANVKGLNLPPQDLDWLYEIGRLLVYTVGSALMGLAIIVLIRNLVATIVAIFILPMVEAITSAILAPHNIQTANFLPYSALDRVIGTSELKTNLSVPKAVLVFLAYLVGVWVVSWYLFLRRDAN